MAEYADYHHAMAQHAAALSNSNQLHPAMAQIPMSQMLSAGLNLTVMSNQLTNNNTGQHHLSGQGGHHVMYANVQTGGGGGGGQSGHGGGGSHKKQKKPKVNKDGVPAPKRATTAYINFTQWYREELKKAGRPIPKIGDFGKECAGKWNTMAEEDKKPFLETAARDRERYKREMAVFKPARDANKPKRPGTAFMLFMGDFRKEMAGKEPEGGVAALAKLGGERWRNMTEDDKRPYVEKQNEEKIRYEASMEDYRRKGAPPVMGGPSPKQARLSTEGSENDDSDSDSLHQTSNEMSVRQQQQQQHHQTSNMITKQNQSTPSPASSSPPTQLTMTPSPSGGTTGQQQSIANTNNNMTSLPSLSTPMSLSHALSATHASAALMAGYSQHSFTANFGHPSAAGVLSGTASTNYNQAHAHTGNMAPNTTPYLPTGAGGAYSQLQGPYSWN